jgi:hypothetical protein
LEHTEWHGTDITTYQGGIDDVLRMPHARHEHECPERIIAKDGDDLADQFQAIGTDIIQAPNKG